MAISWTLRLTRSLRLARGDASDTTPDLVSSIPGSEGYPVLLNRQSSMKVGVNRHPTESCHPTRTFNSLLRTFRASGPLP
jgi:hypothetical protein